MGAIRDSHISMLCNPIMLDMLLKTTSLENWDTSGKVEEENKLLHDKTYGYERLFNEWN